MGVSICCDAYLMCTTFFMAISSILGMFALAEIAATKIFFRIHNKKLKCRIG
jgi:hypothetical protein